MLQEKPDNFLPWRERLEQLESLPGEYVTDQNQLWEKLDGHLQQAPRKTKREWYWFAAACLLFISMLPLIPLQKKPKSPVMSKTVQTQEKITRDVLPAVVTHTAPSVPLHVAGKQVPRAYSQKKKHGRTLKAAELRSTTVLRFDEPIVMEAPKSLIVPHNRDSLLMASSQPAKKKLRVVHINELEQPLRENIQPGSKNATAVFQLPRAKQFYSPGLELGRNTSEDIFKIKLSPSN